MNRESIFAKRVVVLGIWLGLGLVSLPFALWAEEIRCPVCGQTFPSQQEDCPNDGTNLRLLGHTPAPDDQQSSSENQTDGGVPAPDEDKVSDGEAPVPEEADPRYQRRDRGGARKRTTVEEDVTYTDRRSRIRAERRGPAAAAAVERRKKDRAQHRKQFENEDQLRKDQFAKRRRGIWHERWTIGQEAEQARYGLALARTRWLYELAAPLASIGMRYSWMGEGNDPGPVGAVEIDLNVPRQKFRIGLSTSLGVRYLEQRSDLVVLESLTVGLQRPWRWSPYLVARAGIGALATERFGANLLYFLTFVGAEAGIDCRLRPAFVVTPSVGYVRYVANDVYWDSFTAKVSVGF